MNGRGVLMLSVVMGLLGVGAGWCAEPAAKGSGRAWPMLGGTPQRNMVNTIDRNLPTEWSVAKSGPKNVKWIAEIGTRGYLPPAIAGGKVFLGTNNGKPRDPLIKGARGVMMCFREVDGQFLWQIVHDMPPPEIVTLAKEDGLLSTPVVEGNRMYYLAPAAELVCADTDGKVIWRLDMMKDLGVSPCYVSYCAPLIVGDLVFTLTGNGRIGGDQDNRLPAPQAPSFVAVNKTTGKLVWKDSSPGDRIMEGQWANPAYAEVNGKPQVIFPGGDGWLYAFEPATGQLIWKFDCNPKGSLFKPGGRGTRNYLMAPVVHDNKVYTGIGQNPENGSDISHIWCVDITRRGDLSAELEKGQPNPNSGVIWKFGGKAAPGGPRDFTFGRTISNCAIHEGLLFAAELDGFLHCLDVRTGQHYWEEDLKSAVWASPLWVDGKIYLGDDQGTVHIFAHGKEKKVIAKIEMDEGMKAAPVVANGVLYLVGDRHLYAIASK
jgi:outer membrane protein assembly factor BamB